MRKRKQVVKFYNLFGVSDNKAPGSSTSCTECGLVYLFISQLRFQTHNYGFLFSFPCFFLFCSSSPWLGGIGGRSWISRSMILKEVLARGSGKLLFFMVMKSRISNYFVHHVGKKIGTLLSDWLLVSGCSLLWVFLWKLHLLP